jgi:hypothetical protein
VLPKKFYIASAWNKVICRILKVWNTLHWKSDLASSYSFHNLNCTVKQIQIFSIKFSFSKKESKKQRLEIIYHHVKVTNRFMYSSNPKFGNARERMLWSLAFFVSDPKKSNFCRIATKFFMAVAMMGSIKLIFFRFFLSRGGGRF